MAGTLGETEVDTDLCIYHHKKWRNKFQCVINRLCGKVIPTKYIKRVGKLVCTCRQNDNDKSEEDKMEVDSLKSLKKYYHSYFDKPTNRTNLLCDVENLLHECLFDANPSQQKLLQVIKLCLEQNFNLFDVKPKRKKLWKQTYDYEETFELVVPLQYIQFIFGSGGQYIKDICRENDCEIRFDIPKYRAASCVRAKTMFKTSPVIQTTLLVVEGWKVDVKIYTKKLETASIVKDILTAHITRKTEKRKRHDCGVEKWRKHILDKRLDRMHRNPYYSQCKGQPLITAIDMKEMLTRDYTVKAHKKQKERNMGRYEKKKSPLQNTVCRNCLEHFEENTFKDGACKFHSGYLLKKNIGERADLANMEANGSSTEFLLKEMNTWSCCGEVCHSTFNKIESHRETGCTTGRHLYRPMKKNNASRREPVASLDSSEN